MVIFIKFSRVRYIRDGVGVEVFGEKGSRRGVEER